ncbi:tRNA preQ1(34) S-adenosylmethionine ribosyltransferase-isomerase QueA [Trichlorobacter ammonificans]|uniref:S-adenosylmethionine:tRNA ribosyltransferase-isomerase n=1 Tax=Trichlorobacter ammonificans TaxID=2916410 RepID=A0ABM9DBD5_9BACT|nr:tRNA preQ1(34) S-adenosylmethionine ribosyltransferase-isomerase QueA [Trichlorobacter ammonificans]CAH2031653.1 tRNA preQ1(34) S-adenosylmethionine ribosyltransferase-isomerase [Trichlorobacter ammonificans]
MLVSDFHFDLPDDLIARYPAPHRDGSRLMVLYRREERIEESLFGRIGCYLRPGDLLVLNDTRVIPARLHGTKETGGRVELLLVRAQEGSEPCWQCMLRSSKPCRPGQIVRLPDGVTAKVIERSGEQEWLVRFAGCDDFGAWLLRAGELPIPPYLGRGTEELDRERYQTVYAAEAGAVAAPTAGLHFTPQLLDSLRSQGIATATVTLHVGPGTFQPLRVEQVREHRMHGERFRIPAATATAVAATRAAGGRIIAVGTTVARTLEHAADENGLLRPGEGETDIFLYPGCRFRAVDALLTNFHLPESTLLMLVSAFAGQDFVRRAYRTAVEKRFRFYSYGDAMLIL